MKPSLVWKAQSLLYNIIVTVAVIHHVVNSHPHNERVLENGVKFKRCGMRTSMYDRLVQARAVRKFQSQYHQFQLETSFDNNNIVTIPVCFHIMTGKKGMKNINDAALQRQLDALNRAHSSASCCNDTLPWCSPGSCSVNTGFRFGWAVVDPTTGNVVDDELWVANIADPQACVFRSDHAHWDNVRTSSVHVLSMKRHLYKGNKKVLNVYWTSLKDAVGFSMYPWSIAGIPNWVDGVIVHRDTYPGGPLSRFNEGDTLTHEVGHWLGLLHTFEGGCHYSDGIADTPPEKNPYYYCNVTRVKPDSCPRKTGTDPIFNFMDYSDDRCLYQFTPGQVLAMRASYEYYRLGDRADANVITLTSGVPAAAVYLIPGGRQIYQLQAAANTTSPVTCTFSTGEGKISFYMRWGKPPLFRRFLDHCTRYGKRGSCTTHIRYGKDILYVGVRASGIQPVQNVVVTCTVK